MDERKYEELLEQVRKPGRYLGNEWNSVKKDLAKMSIRFALVFPDLYEIGMSHLGFKILYHLLNKKDDIACERVFSPDSDLEAILRRESLPLFTLESKEPIANFDVIGFSLSYELNYTNVLNVLDLGGIPLAAEERDERYPIIIAGGSSVCNPEPIARFIDLFFIGEAEEAMFEVLDEIKAHKKRPEYRKTELLKSLSRIKGVYVPSFYATSNNEDGSIKDFKALHEWVPRTVAKRIVDDLESSFYPTKQIVPFINIVHDRVSIEIMRGCPNLCRFCQARVLYHRKRERLPETIIRLAKESIAETGYEEISLLSLSSGNHSQIVCVIRDLICEFLPKGISVSLPSLRIDKILKEFPALLSRIKKSGLTFAPEAGSERLRQIIRKDIDIEQLIPAIDAACASGWSRVKLYFMIGLPTESYEDIDCMINQISEITGRHRNISVTVSITSFMPKPHTPFQWRGMMTEEELNARIIYIKKKIKTRRVRLKFHDVRLSILEGIFSRGDRRLSGVLLRAFNKGCRFDGWDDRLNYAAWMESFREEGIDPNLYLKKSSFTAILPWEHIDCGIHKDFLMKEAQAAAADLTKTIS